MNTKQLANMPLGLELERLIAECLAVGADPHKVIALALTPEMRDMAETSGMTMKEQAALAWKVVDKANASKKALDIDANITGTIVMLQPSDADL